MGEQELSMDCPTCGKRVVRPACGSARRDAPHFPFCSERCRLIDLGKWFDGEHRIEEPLDPDAPEGGREAE